MRGCLLAIPTDTAPVNWGCQSLIVCEIADVSGVFSWLLPKSNHVFLKYTYMLYT